MNVNEYKQFLDNHNQLQDPYVQWIGTLYLPPCTCSSSSVKFIESSNTLKFDFSKYDNIAISKLINLCNFNSPNSYHNEKNYTLCQKYFLHRMNEEVIDCSTKQDVVAYVKSSDLFKHQLDLLRND